MFSHWINDLCTLIDTSTPLKSRFLASIQICFGMLHILTGTAVFLRWRPVTRPYICWSSSLGAASLTIYQICQVSHTPCCVMASGGERPRCTRARRHPRLERRRFGPGLEFFITGLVRPIKDTSQDVFWGRRQWRSKRVSKLCNISTVLWREEQEMVNLNMKTKCLIFFFCISDLY